MSDKNSSRLCACGCGDSVKSLGAKWIKGHHLLKPLPFCACGCGQQVNLHRQKWIKGHNKKKPRALCACGCGQQVAQPKHKWIRGHHLKGVGLKPTVNGLRQCSKCKEWLVPGSFGKHSGVSDGLHSWCKVCEKVCRDKIGTDARREYNKQYRQKNAERLSEKDREWYQRNQEKVKRYREENAEEIRQRQRRWRDANADYDTHWRKANTDKVRAYSANRAARERGAEGEVNEAVITQMVVDQQGQCAYCECALLGEWEIDHMVPLSRGGVHDAMNLAITCRSCNRRKSAKTVEEFFALER